MKRWTIALLLLVAGCGSTPPPAAVQTTSTTTTTTTVTTTSPRIDTPRKLAGVDPCSLLVASDFDEPLFAPPAPFPNLPNACEYRVGNGTEKDLFVIAAIAGPYDRSVKSGSLLDGHSTSTSCIDGPECTIVVAVSETQTLKIIVHLEGGNDQQRAQILWGKAGNAVKRLPVTG
ncbi:hypothetical protein BBK82_19420 [Lentzea guizhouensis]|uniref:DUF3558 domain-containing protein n=1 Tax=Lentzea guizhouensis TaxID=1586287 RepID=A0A1B2HJL2_9PSEU|nr:DUF3558 domain-containing protein [Lentzea guizhouensis]ANZ37904.1 hypothetical protein BBK82_19420 [Lentzea guizhouensis]